MVSYTHKKPNIGVFTLKEFQYVFKTSILEYKPADEISFNHGLETVRVREPRPVWTTPILQVKILN